MPSEAGGGDDGFVREEFAFGDGVVELAEEVDVHGPGVSCVVDVVASHGGVDFDEVVGMFQALGLTCIFTIGSAISFSFFFFSFSEKHMRESAREREENKKTHPKVPTNHPEELQL